MTMGVCISLLGQHERAALLHRSPEPRPAASCCQDAAAHPTAAAAAAAQLLRCCAMRALQASLQMMDRVWIAAALTA